MTSSAPGNERERDDANAVVLNYLRKMGYRQTERIFRDEAHVAGLETLAFELRNEQDSNIANYLLFAANGANLDVTAYEAAYEALRQWTFESLDAFRDELVPLLYPVFVHCILDMIAKGALNEARAFLARFKEEHQSAHEDEILTLSGLSEPSQVKENPLAVTFRTNKYNVSMSAYAFQLLMGYLQDTTSSGGMGGNVLILKIINQYVNIRVLVTKPSGNAALSAASAAGMTGVAAEAAVSMNKSKVQWGVNAVDPAIEAALQQRAKAENRLNEILQGPLAQLKRLYAQSSLNAPPSSEASAGSSLPRPTPGAAETNAEIDRLRNLAKRAALSSTALPSICCYTLQNSYEGITSIDFSPISTLMATGNRDSYIDIWALNHEPLRAIRPSTELAAMDLNDCISLVPRWTLMMWCSRVAGADAGV